MTDPLSRALREHGDALAATVDTMLEIDPEAWERPWAEGKWSPAQICEHLVLTYEGAIRDLAGDGTVRAKVGPRWQRALRWFLLPHILFHRNFPLRANAPREWRPEGQGIDAAEAASSLPEVAQRFETEAARAYEEGRSLNHPYFGSVDALRALRLAAVHLEHHRRQMMSCLVIAR